MFRPELTINSEMHAFLIYNVLGPSGL